MLQEKRQEARAIQSKRSIIGRQSALRQFRGTRQEIHRPSRCIGYAARVRRERLWQLSRIIYLFNTEISNSYGACALQAQ